MAQTQSASHDNSRHSQYSRVFALGFSGFIFNTTEFAPVGLLSDIAKDFSISTASVGWMLTIYAWIVASMSLPMMMLTAKVERKKLLLCLFALFITSHALSVFAWNFEVLIVSRVGIAFAHAVFWSITASIAIRVAPPGKKTFALSVLSTGTSLALVLGVPLGRIVGQWLGWRVTFGAIGLSALMMMFILYRMLPKMPSLFTGSTKKLPELLKNPALTGIYLFIFMIFTAHYTSYSYIEPFLKDIGALTENFTTFLLLLFGSAGIIGSVIFGHLGDRPNTPFLLFSIAMVALSTGLLYFAVPHLWSICPLLIIWSAAITLTSLVMQVKALNIDTNASDMIMSMYSGIINLGIGAGALIGGKVIHAVAIDNIGYVSALFASVSLVWILLLLKKYPAIR